MEKIQINGENEFEKVLLSHDELVFMNLAKWQTLQELLKEEITLNQKIKSQRKSDLEHMKRNYKSYYEAKLKIKQTYEIYVKLFSLKSHTDEKTSVNIELEENMSDFGDLELRIKTLLNNIRNNYTNIIFIIDSLSEENKNEMADFLAHFFFENILIQNPEFDELLIFTYILLEKEINSLITPSLDSFLDFSFMGRFLKSLCRRIDIKNYLSLTLKDLIYDLENQSENFMDIDLQVINDKIKTNKIDSVFYQNYDLEKIKILYENNKNLGLAYNIRVSTLMNYTKQKHNNFAPLEKSFIAVDMIKTEILKLKETGVNISITESIEYISENNEEKVNEKNSEKTDGNDIDSANGAKSEKNEYVEVNHDYKFDITEEEIVRRYLKETDSHMKTYYSNLFKHMASDNTIYSNINFFENISNFNDDELKVLFVYKINFEKIKAHIDQLISSIMDNSSTIPYIVKCICKIIHILISKKFPKLSNYEKNSFIGKFLFGRCIMPIIVNPDYNGIIYSHIISSETRKNLRNINKILGKIYKANLFNSNIDPNFTFFNCYLLEIFPTINKLYDSLISVKLSEKLQHLIDIGLDKFLEHKESNQLYYFENYPGQIYNIQCICFSLNIINVISNTIEENKTDYLQNSTKEKVNFSSLCKSICEDLKQIKRKFANSNIALNKYYIHFNKCKNPKYKDFFIKNSKFTFYENESLAEESILSKVKFCIRKIIKSLNLINPRVYSSLADADNTVKFFLGLDKVIELEDNSETINTIPLNWYSMYMTSYFELLSNYYKSNNFNPLYEEMLSEAVLEIEKLKNISNSFNSKLGMNLRCSEKIVEYAKRDYLKLKNIENFIRIEKFLDSAKIKICIKKSTKEELQDNTDLPPITISSMETCIHQSLYYVTRLVDGKTSKKNELSDSKAKRKNSRGSHSSNTNLINPSSSNSLKTETGNIEDNIGIFGECHCENIFEFIRSFQKFKEIKDDIENGEAACKIGETLGQYLKFVSNVLNKDRLFIGYDINAKCMILEDIENYILRKMYRNVFPEDQLDNDIKFNLQCKKFSWVQPIHLEIKKKLINEALWQQGIILLSRLDYEKSPLEKLNCIQSVLKIIKNSINFCLCEDEKFAGADDQNPIFIFMVLKANLKKYISNINYIYTFIHDEKKTNYYGQTLSLMDFAKNYIMGMNKSYFDNLTDSEYDEFMMNSAIGKNDENSGNQKIIIKKKRGQSIYANII